jgi:hypothetical protein
MSDKQPKSSTTTKKGVAKDEEVGLASKKRKAEQLTPAPEPAAPKAKQGQNKRQHLPDPQQQEKKESPVKTSATAAVGRTRVVRMQRSGGRVVQSCDVYIGRRWTMGGWDLPQSKWANPFTVKKAGSAAKAVELYEEHIRQSPQLLASLAELEGKTLGCWCKKKPTDPCHGDVLVRLVNEARHTQQ